MTNASADDELPPVSDLPLSEGADVLVEERSKAETKRCIEEDLPLMGLCPPTD